MKYLILILFVTTLNIIGGRPDGTTPQSKTHLHAAVLNRAPQNCISATPSSCPFIMAGHY